MPVFLLAIVTLAIKQSAHTGFWRSLGIAALMSFVPFALFVAGLASGFLLPGLGYPLLGLLISLVVAALINNYVLDHLTNLEKTWGPSIGVTILAFGAFIGILTANNPMCSRRAAWSSRAKGTLRSIGSSQLAYQGANTEKLYGTFDALKKDMYVAEGYTLSNMIENYSMTWQVSNISTAVSEEFPSGVVSSFTVISWPRDTRRGFLNTFAITEDQVVRAYNPSNKNRLGHVVTWDPIL